LTKIFDVFNNYLTTRVIDIAPGDTLWSLAKAHLGNGQRWRELYFLNLDQTLKAQETHKGKMTPDLIYSSNTLRIFAF
jgi:nucleoid-associated protein YgaU